MVSYQNILCLEMEILVIKYQSTTYKKQRRLLTI